MKRKAFRRRAAAFGLALVMMCLCASPWTVSATPQTELENQLAELKKQQQTIQKNLNQAKEELDASQQRQNLINAQIANVRSQLSILDQQLTTLDKQLSETQKQIDATAQEIQDNEASVQDTKEKLGQRLRAIMKSGNVTTLQMLLDAQNYTDFLLKSEAVKRISKKDQGTIDALEAALKELAAKKQALVDQQARLQTDRQALDAKIADSNTKKKELDALYASARKESSNYQSTVNSYNAQLKNNRDAQEKANEALEKLLSGGSSSGSYNGKMMYWPVPTVRAISSYWGERWGTTHRGIDIANGPIPIKGQNIVAAADGTVILSNYTSTWGYGWSSGYGYSCVIEHGENSKGQVVTTLYAHCSVMYARVGQKVTGGKTVIGKAGNTGNVTGPHLHFEVRLDGKSVNPYPTYVHPNVN